MRKRALAPVAAKILPELLPPGADALIWFGVIIAMNLQTSFLTPPFGFSLFYLRSVAPKEVTTGHLYRGAVPFIVLQLLMVAVLIGWPELVRHESAEEAAVISTVGDLSAASGQGASADEAIRLMQDIAREMRESK